MLHFTRMPLDRQSNLRRDADWLASAESHPGSRFVLLHSNKNLFTVDGDAAFLTSEQLAEIPVENPVYLGMGEHLPGAGERHYFALDVSGCCEETLAFLAPNFTFMDLRSRSAVLPHTVGSLLGMARGLCHWHATHCFCGRCGKANGLSEAGHSRTCKNAECGHQTFPRTDPAVIMIVRKLFDDGIERCLLGRQASWPEGVYSTLAGFVDPGETLEQAVVREVMEEAGVPVTDVRYIASQPWPFPSSIMLGFLATATSEEILVDEDELQEARWFSRAELDTFGEWGDEGPGFKLTRVDSISRFLIEHWRQLAENEEQS